MSSPTPVLLIFLMILAILVGVKGYLIVALICIFLMTNDVIYLFKCLLATCVSSLEKCPFDFFANLLIGLFFHHGLLNIILKKQ